VRAVAIRAGQATGRAAPDTTTPRLEHETFTLKNGLKVILSQDKRLPMVAVNLWYHVGPANEIPGRRGFASRRRIRNSCSQPLLRRARVAGILAEAMCRLGFTHALVHTRTYNVRHRAFLNWIRYGRRARYAAIGVWCSPRQCDCQRYELKFAGPQPHPALGVGGRPFNPAWARCPL
jgi:hypothetical protein